MASATAHNIAILNRSKAITDPDAAALVADLQSYVSHHFAKVWNIDARLRFVPSSDTTTWKGAWNLLLMDNSDEANALGYHDMTPEGLPVGKAFIATDLKYGAEPSVTVAHELVEMLLDPHINLYAFDSHRGLFSAYEAADAVEADELAFKVGTHLMSDFVTPSFFDPSRLGSTDAFSYRQNVHQPFQLAKGGYEIIYVPGKGWTQKTAREVPLASDRPRVGSRRERRMNRGAWQMSEP